MKKITLFVVGALALTLTGCGALGTSLATGGAGSNVLGSLAQTATQGQTLTNILTSFIGADKALDVTGTWKYSQPGCAFTSKNALASAGGEVIAQEIKNKLAPQYNTLGFKASNTQFTFNKDNTFSAKILGTPVSGTYTFDSATQALNMSINLLGVPAYTLNGAVKKNTNGIALLFDAKKILQIMQTLGAVNGAGATLATFSDLASKYDAVRVGFDMTK